MLSAIFQITLRNCFILYLCLNFVINGVFSDHNSKISCQSLLPGQYLCYELQIDADTQQPVGCNEDDKAYVECAVRENLQCDTLSHNKTFFKEIPCRYTNGKDFRTALLLSIFFGWLGIDRFYLGYAAVGLFKLFTFGFFFIFHLVDIILIALQIVGPADGSGYVIDYYGPKATYVKFTNATFIVPPYSWSEDYSYEL